MTEQPFSEIDSLLAKKGYRLTENRLRVYKTIAQHEEALSMNDIELVLEDVDKSTIFRSLQLFLEVGILHRIDDGTGIYKYALSEIDGQEVSPTHAHFYCKRCERTFCIEGVSYPLKLNLPDGFSSESINLVIKGVCAYCR